MVWVLSLALSISITLLGAARLWRHWMPHIWHCFRRPAPVPPSPFFNWLQGRVRETNAAAFLADMLACCWLIMGCISATGSVVALVLRPRSLPEATLHRALFGLIPSTIMIPFGLLFVDMLDSYANRHMQGGKPLVIERYVPRRVIDGCRHWGVFVASYLVSRTVEVMALRCLADGPGAAVCEGKYALLRVAFSIVLPGLWSLLFLTTFRSAVLQDMLGSGGIALLAVLLVPSDLAIPLLPPKLWMPPFFLLLSLYAGVVMPLFAYAHVLWGESSRANTLNQFLRYMSHEVRVPANTAVLAVEEVLLDLDDASVPQAVCGARAPALEAKTALQHMKTLLDRTLDLARLEAGHVSLQLDAFHLATLWKSAHASVAASFRASGVRLDMAASEEVLAQWVRGDALRLQQSLTNILHNGSKYTPAGGWVKCSLRLEPGSARRDIQRPGWCWSRGTAQPTTPLATLQEGHEGPLPKLIVTVQDSGRGMTAEEAERLFTPFARLHSAEEGTGLGLNIARRAMRAHGGDVTVHSPGLGKGCTFTISAVVRSVPPKAQDAAAALIDDSITTEPKLLQGSTGSGASSDPGEAKRVLSGEAAPGWRLTMPSAAPSLTPQVPGVPAHSASTRERTVSAASGYSSAPSSVAGEGCGSLRVLVVDDDAATRRVLRRVLQRHPAVLAVAEAADGQAAVQAAGAEGGGGAPHLITMDNSMPIMTGVAATAKLRASGFTGRIVGMTGNALKTDQEEFLEAGADVVLTKPIDRDSVRAQVTAALARHPASAPAAEVAGGAQTVTVHMLPEPDLQLRHGAVAPLARPWRPASVKPGVVKAPESDV